MTWILLFISEVPHEGYYTGDSEGAVYTNVFSLAVGIGYKKACVQQPQLS